VREDLRTGEILREDGHVLVPDGFDIGLEKRRSSLNNANTTIVNPNSFSIGFT
jgi:hypothetical protein